VSPGVGWLLAPVESLIGEVSLTRCEGLDAPDCCLREITRHPPVRSRVPSRKRGTAIKRSPQRVIIRSALSLVAGFSDAEMISWPTDRPGFPFEMPS
jgi:hypothetical protein